MLLLKSGLDHHALWATQGVKDETDEVAEHDPELASMLRQITDTSAKIHLHLAKKLEAPDNKTPCS